MSGAPQRIELRLPHLLPEPISHYTDAVWASGWLWVSGLLALDAGGTLMAPGDVLGQAEQVFRNLEGVLEAAGLGFSDVVKVTLYLIDIDDRPVINRARQTVFGAARPASTLVQVAALAVPGALLEVDAVAVAPNPPAVRDRGVAL